MAGCKWNQDSDQNYVLRKLCEAMAQDQLDQPFWIRSYLISPQGQTIQGSGADQCVQYRIKISRPNLKKQNPAAPRGQRDVRAAGRRRQVGGNICISSNQFYLYGFYLQQSCL